MNFWLSVTFTLLIGLLPLGLGGAAWWAHWPANFIILLVFAGVFWRCHPQPRRLLPSQSDPVTALLFGLLLWGGLVCLPFAVVLAEAVAAWVSCFCLFLLVLLARFVVWRKNKGHVVATGLAAAGVLQVTIGILQVLGWLLHGHWNPSRFMAGTFINHNHFAGLLHITIPVSLTLIIFYWPRLSRALKGAGFAALGLQVLGIILALSRGAWLGFAAQALFLGLVLARTPRARRLAGLAGTILLVAVIWIFWGSESTIAIRGQSVLEWQGDTSIASRFKVWQATLQMIRDNWLVGVGPGCFAESFPHYRPPGLGHFINHAHNEYLEWIAEWGVPVLLFLVLLPVFIVRRGLRVPLTRSPLPLAAAAALVAHLVHGLTDFNSSIPAVAMFMAILVGLSLGVDEK